MRRREFISLMAASVALSPSAGLAQRPIRARRVGILIAARDKYLECFLSSMNELGWIEGKNLKTEVRTTAGVFERLQPLVGELAEMNPDIIVVMSTPGAQAAQRATSTIPIVFASVSDPVKSGIVASLSRPGGNITGVSNFLPATTGKLLELLRKAVPGASRFAVLHNPSNPGKILEVEELRKSARVLSVVVETIEVQNAADFDRAFTSIENSDYDGLVVLQDGVTGGNAKIITEFATRKRLPAIYQLREYVVAGGLMSYGLNFCEHFKRAAMYADQVLKGARPSDLPVELPSTFELVVNLTVARAINLSIPSEIIVVANEVIE